MTKGTEVNGLERDYVVPLRRGFRIVPKHKRAKKAVKTLKDFMSKHMRSDNILIGQHLNEYIWSRGMKNPPHHVKVHAVKDSKGVVRVAFYGKEFKESVRPLEVEEKQGIKDKLLNKVGLGKKDESAGVKKDAKTDKIQETPVVKENVKKDNTEEKIQPATPEKRTPVSEKKTE